MLRDLFIKGASEIGIDMTEEMVEKFFTYMEELVLWNKKTNLTSITKEHDVIVKHFLDSLVALKVRPIFYQSIIDVGAGAGFPGIPIRIVRPEVRLTLLDSANKKAAFLQHVSSKLGLSDVSVVWGRAEDIVSGMREGFDIAISRAVAPLNILCEYCLPFVKKGGQMIALKSDKIEEEVRAAKNAINLLGGALQEVKKIKLPTTNIVRSVVLIKKTSRTDVKFPRKAGLIKKKPL